MRKLNLQLSVLAILITVLPAFTATAQIDNIRIGKIIPTGEMDFASEKPTYYKFETATKGYYSPTLMFQDKPSPARIASGTVGDANITINYSSPAVKNRTVWDDLVPYNKVWRAGANEATIFETDKDIKVEGKELKAGKYSLFAIPTRGEWTVIFNEVTGQWGTQHDESKDVLRVKVTPRKSTQMNERLTYEVEDDKFVLKWEQMEVPVSISK